MDRTLYDDPYPATPSTFDVGSATARSLLVRPPDADLLYVFGHGAGAGMWHRSMEAIAQSLARARIATFRYNFVYMEAGRGVPDRHPLLLATVRAAVEAAQAAAPDLPLIAGGKSMGGRMTSMAQADTRLAPSGTPVRGLLFYGFPLHPTGRPGLERAEHLAKVDLPMLFLQGDRDDLADLELLRTALSPLARATLQIVPGGDHSLHVRGRKDPEVLDEAARTVRNWVTSSLWLP